MKLTLILLIAFVLHAGARGTAQTVTLSVRDMPLEKVCKEIERQTGHYFLYAKDVKLNNALVSVNFTETKLSEVLDSIFKGLLFNWEIIEKVIIIKKIDQQKAGGTVAIERLLKARGLVINEQGQPLPGATVIVKHSNQSTLSNTKGEFFLDRVPINSVLIISFIGYVSKEISLKSDEFMQVRLIVSNSLLDATVIKGYYSTSNRLNTGNVATVKAEEIVRQPVMDPLLALEGRVAGLYISQTSGVPGSSSKVTLRGQNSIPNPTTKLITVNDPLYIVDGVPFGSASLTGLLLNSGAAGSQNLGTGLGLSPFNNLNPSDIESIDILKDADATAIYGSRGANGVILITTKKGKPGATHLNLNMYSGVSKITRKFHLLNTQEYLNMRREAFRNDGRNIGLTDYDINGTWDTTRFTDWQKVLIGNAARFTNVQTSISGGDINTQFLIGATYSLQRPSYPGDYKDQKVSIHTSMSNQSFDRRLRTQMNVQYTNDINNLPNIDLTSKILLAPDAPAIYDSTGKINWQIKNGRNTWQNPLRYIVQTDKANTKNLVADINLGYIITPGLELKGNLGYTWSKLNQTNLTPSTFSPPPYNMSAGSSSNELGTTELQTWIIEPQITYRAKIRKGILDILGGSTFQENTNSTIAYRSYGFASDDVISNPAAASVFLLSGSSYTQYRYNAIFGRVGYTWDDKYILNVTGRRDGSSRFGPGRQFGNFGAVGCGWIFSKEPFVSDNLHLLSFGKLRLSYGSTGNDGIQDYSFLNTYTPVSTTFQGITALSPDRLTNPYIGWEEVKKLEGGLEMGFFQDKILFTISYYRNRTYNQLVGYGLPLITGFGSVQFNLPAILQNTGIEVTLNTINYRSKNFSWTNSLNLSIPKNKLVAFPNIENYPSYNFSYVIGQSLNIERVYHYLGVNPQTGLYAFNTKSAAARPSYPEDLFIHSPVTQTFFGGFNNNISYKGFTLDLFFQFVKQTGYNYLTSFSPPGLFNSNQSADVLRRWTSPGQVTDVQRFSIGTGFAYWSAKRNSDAAIVDASFIRLKNFALFYQLPDNIMKKMGLTTTRFYVQCQNLITITRFEGMDPETGGLNLPPLRVVTAGVQVIL